MAERISIREFARRMNCSDTAIRKAITSGKIESGFDPVTKTINPRIAALEYKDASNPMRKTILDKKTKGKPAKKTGRKQVAQAEETDDEDDESPAGKSAPTSTAVIKRQQAIYALKSAKLDYEKKAGELVPKDAVYRQLFAFAQEVRSGFQMIPDRVIDEMISVKTRTESLEILTREIDAVLLKLSNIESVEITERT